MSEAPEDKLTYTLIQPVRIASQVAVDAKN